MLDESHFSFLDDPVIADLLKQREKDLEEGIEIPFLNQRIKTRLHELTEKSFPTTQFVDELTD